MLAVWGAKRGSIFRLLYKLISKQTIFLPSYFPPIHSQIQFIPPHKHPESNSKNPAVTTYCGKAESEHFKETKFMAWRGKTVLSENSHHCPGKSIATVLSFCLAAIFASGLFEFRELLRMLEPLLVHCLTHLQ